MYKPTKTRDQNTANEQDNKKYITVGVSFRTDSSGDAHKENDRKAMEALNQLGLGFKVEVKTLPIGAKGASVLRNMSEESIQWDLQDVDLLYIPGSGAALEEQIASTDPNLDPAKAKEEEQLKKTSVRLEQATIKFESARKDAETRLETAKTRLTKATSRMENTNSNMDALTGAPSKKEIEFNNAQKEVAKAQEALEKIHVSYAKEKRPDDEYQSRDAYETRLIQIAKTRGMIILAVCGGSWRLLKAYDGVIATLPIADRAKHAAVSGDIWMLNHDIHVQEDSMLSSCVLKEKGCPTPNVVKVNSTHWAAPKLDPNDSTKLQTITSEKYKDHHLLKINAMASTGVESSDTPEGFETLFGAPIMGLQFHPEKYLPGMRDASNANNATADNATIHFAQQIFINAAKAAFAYKTKRACVSMTPGLQEPKQLLKTYSSVATEALYKQGCDYYHGNKEKGILPDMKMAAQYFKQAADHQHAGAQSKLGDILEHGRLGPPDIARAVKCYKAAALQDELLAMFSLALCYEHGTGVKKDIAHATKLFQAAYDRGYEGWKGYFKDFLTRYPQAHGYLNAQHDPIFLEETATLTPAEHARKGRDYYHGNKNIGLQSNMRLAAGHLRIAAEHGDAKSQHLLGDILEHGRGTSIHLEEAIKFYQLSADQQYPSALFALGRCYELGKGVKPNLERAAELYEAAFSKGYEGWKGYFKAFIGRNPSLTKTPSLLGQYNQHCAVNSLKHKTGIIQEKIVPQITKPTVRD